jgi:hypothetical protein
VKDPLDAVAIWIVAGGVAHVLASAEPLRALCGRDQWTKAALTETLWITSKTGKTKRALPRRVCAACRSAYNNFPPRRPRLQDIQPTVERQLAFAGDWGDEP